MSESKVAGIEQDATEEAQSLVRRVGWRVLIAVFGLIAHEAAVFTWRQLTGGPPPRRRARKA
jgi:hypothetical protein